MYSYMKKKTFWEFGSTSKLVFFYGIRLSAERGENVTVVGIVIANDGAMQAVYIYPRMPCGWNASFYK